MGLLACAVVSLLLTAPAFGGAEARISAMRAGNEMPADVGVYSQVPGYFAAQPWQRVVTRTAKSSVDLPKVPAAAVLGADTADGYRCGEPVTAVYPSSEIDSEGRRRAGDRRAAGGPLASGWWAPRRVAGLRRRETRHTLVPSSDHD